MHAFRICSLFAGTLLIATGCPQPEPVYDDELGLQAVSVDPGSLAGTWAQKHSIVNIADLPLIGPQLAGGETYLLVERIYNDGGMYTQTSTVCQGRNYDVGGTSSFLYDEQWRSVPPITIEQLEVDEGLGTFDLKDHVQMWGYDIDDPINDDFPSTADEANNQTEFSDRVIDGDDDGNTGVTMELEGFVTGNAYFIQRKTVSLHGVITDEDTHKGLIDDYLYETVTIGSDNELLENQLDRTVHEDPKQSWYIETRVDDGMDCDGVVEFIKDGGVPRLNPFLAPD